MKVDSTTAMTAGDFGSSTSTSFGSCVSNPDTPSPTESPSKSPSKAPTLKVCFSMCFILFIYFSDMVTDIHYASHIIIY